ncbi:MAG: MarC family protein [Nitrosomonadales bacterium]|nr:MAG: MarC family protein [Nitrosomonadales bacterium]
MSEYFKSAILLFTLLNPFLTLVYLIEMVKELAIGQFAKIVIYAGLVASVVYSCFAILGDAIFGDIVQAEFASFQIFGGVIMLIIGLQFVFRGPMSLTLLKSKSGYSVGAVAMPVLIGPGTISASLVIGKRLDQPEAIVVIFVAVALAILVVILLKLLHDFVLPRSEPLVNRYIEITGRISALYVGTVAVEMIMKGLGTWVGKYF